MSGSMRGTDRIALGCDRLGSVNGLTANEAGRLIRDAFETGIRMFDTAPVYGQGESERLLGQILAAHREEVTIITKVGQFFPWSSRLLFPVKSLVRGVAARSPRISGMVAARRAGILPRRFDREFIWAEVERSLDRLGCDHIDILLLHSPEVAQISARSGLDAVAELQRAGLVGRIGVAGETAIEALAALDDPRVEVLEFPYSDDDATDRILARSAERGVETVVRGVLHNQREAIAEARGPDRKQILARVIRDVLARPGVGRLLVGTTRITHLREVAIAAHAQDMREPSFGD